MSKILDRAEESLGAPEIIQYLSPGLVALTSPLLWAPEWCLTTYRTVIAAIGGGSGTVLLLVIGYVLGIVIDTWESTGYLRWVLLRTKNNLTSGRTRVLGKAELCLLTLFHGVSTGPTTQDELVLREGAYQIIRGCVADPVLILLRPDDLFFVMRTLLEEQKKSAFASQCKEADAAYRRRCFLRRIALAFALLAFQSICVIGMKASGSSVGGAVRMEVLIVIGLLGLFSSVLLRQMSEKHAVVERLFSAPVIKSTLSA